MRRIKLRQRGFRPQGEPFTGEDTNKAIEPEVIAPVVKKTTKKTTKKTSTVKRIIKAITG